MGTVHLVVRAVAEAKGVKTPFALSNLTGLNYAICHRLWQGEQQRVDMSTLASLCDALKIKPGQLFEYTPD
jgi:DNA-binding Xre family transcriptional regulator